MTTIVQMPDGREAEMQIVDKTRPIADKDYECAWGGPFNEDKRTHTIRKGTRYVRIVYKLRYTNEEKGSFSSDHICFDCWNG